MTLAFIGEWPEDVTDVLPPVGKPFSVTLSRIGVFPQAKVLWAGVEESDRLNDLAQRVRRNLRNAGIPFDRKVFRPHITLVRRAAAEREEYPLLDIPDTAMKAERVSLMRSQQGRNGMVYTEIGAVPDGNG